MSNIPANRDTNDGKPWAVSYSKEVEVQPAGEKKNKEINNENDKQITKDENKTGILTKISNNIIYYLEKGFARLGFLIATHPWKTILICCAVIAVTALGFLRFTQTTDSTALWVPYGAKVRDYKYWVDDQFPTTYRFVSMVFVAENAALLPSAVQAMNTVYKNSLSLTTTSGQNYSTICAKSGSTCIVRSILELWSYDDATIQSLTDNDIITQINTVTTSPMYYSTYDVTSQVGGRTYTGSNVTSASAIKISWFINANDTLHPECVKPELTMKSDSAEWETLAINLANAGQNGVTIYVYATRSFGDVSGDAIRGDTTLLSAGYFLMIFFVSMVLGRFNCIEQRVGLAFCGLLVVGMSICFSFSLASAAGWEYGPVHTILPFLLLGIGVDDMFVVVAALGSLSEEDKQKSLQHRISVMLKHAGVSITVTSFTDIVAFGIGGTTVLPALKSFCIFACIGVTALYCLSATFFVACITFDERRKDAGRNACLCCYTHRKDYKTSECSKKERIPIFLKNIYAPWLLKTPVKVKKQNWHQLENIVKHMDFHHGRETGCFGRKSTSRLAGFTTQIIVIIITVIIFGVNIWGLISLKQEVDFAWFLPTDSYAYKYIQIDNQYFSSTGVRAAVYCANIDYFNSKSKLDTLYSNLTSSTYVSSGSVDSWFQSYMDYLSTTTTASVTSQLDANKYPVSDAAFVSMLYDFVTTVASGLRHSGELKFITSNTDIDASYISYTHVQFSDSKSEIQAMDSIQDIVSNIFGGDCFAYGRRYQSWATNKVIQEELYRNIGIAAACVFIVTLVLVANIWTSLMVFSCVAATLVDVGGFMHFWGLTIDTVTCILLILAIGLAVDYSAHVGHCFMTLKGSRNDRAKATLVEIGAPVFSGGFSTFLAFVLLAGSNSYVFTTFFKIFFLVVLFGLFHGLVYLPVILSWLGPSPYLTADDRYNNHDEENKMSNAQIKDDQKTEASTSRGSSPPHYEDVVEGSKNALPNATTSRRTSFKGKITPVQT